jgi:hypothetical protein
MVATAATRAGHARRANTFDSDSDDDDSPRDAASLRASLAQIQQAMADTMNNLS